MHRGTQDFKAERKLYLTPMMNSLSNCCCNLNYFYGIFKKPKERENQESTNQTVSFCMINYWYIIIYFFLYRHLHHILVWSSFYSSFIYLQSYIYNTTTRGGRVIGYIYLLSFFYYFYFTILLYNLVQCFLLSN